MPASIFNGDAVKILKDKLRFKDSTEIITSDTDDPTSVAKDAPQGSLYIQSGTDKMFIKGDAGSSTNWTLLSSDITLQSISTSTAITTLNAYYDVDTATADVTVTLPAASGNAGKWVTVIKTTTDSNSLIVDGNGAETVNGVASDYIGVAYAPFTYICDGTEWFYSGAAPEGRAVYIYDEKGSSAAGGTFTSGAWQTRDLNTVAGDESFATLASNQITLKAGTYIFEASAPAYTVNYSILRLYNTTDSTEVAYTSPNFQGNTNATVAIDPLRSEPLRFTADKTFELQHRCSLTRATNGFGPPASFLTTNKYAYIRITRIA